MNEFDPAQDVLADTERIIACAEEHQVVAGFSRRTMAAGGGLIVVGLASEVLLESFRVTGVLAASIGLVAFMAGGLTWGINEFKRSVNINNIC